MLKRSQVLEDGRVPAKDARSWRMEGQKRRITRKAYQRLLNKFDMEGSCGAKRHVDIHPATVNVHVDAVERHLK